MPSTLVECVPNFSEGRNKAVVDEIIAAMKMDGVYLLDREMDADHNRCVITLVGDRTNIAEAAIRGVGKAAELIDLTKHTGAHPRMGASDVIPFIPIDGVTLEDCVAIARVRRGRDLEALQDPRVSLRIRRPASRAHQPREHPPRPVRRHTRFHRHRRRPNSRLRHRAVHPTAGATVVGARKFLVAYNVYLNTTDVDIAKKVGKAVRFSNGGLRFVKGMGISVRGLAQVSMNLTDTDQTPIARVFEYVKREAARYGVMPLSSEIVGLVPKKALEDAAEWFLQVENFDSSLILENRLAAVMGGKSAVGGLRAGFEPFVEQLAAPVAAPGGGSAAAVAGAMAAGLGSMVAGMSRGKKAYLQYETPLSDAIAQLANLREEFKAAADADTAAYEEVVKAFRKVKQDPAAQGEVDVALKQATNVPLGRRAECHMTIGILESLRPITNPKMASDLTTGLALARAAREGALANVEINLADMDDRSS